MTSSSPSSPSPTLSLSLSPSPSSSSPSSSPLIISLPSLLNSFFSPPLSSSSSSSSSSPSSPIPTISIPTDIDTLHFVFREVSTFAGRIADTLQSRRNINNNNNNNSTFPNMSPLIPTNLNGNVNPSVSNVSGNGQKVKVKKQPMDTQQNSSATSRNSASSSSSSSSSFPSSSSSPSAPLRKKGKHSKIVDGIDISSVHRPLSSYLHFTTEIRPIVLTQHHEKSFTEQGKIMGDMWKSLQPIQKQKYETLAQQDRARYKEEVQRVVDMAKMNNQNPTQTTTTGSMGATGAVAVGGLGLGLGAGAVPMDIISNNNINNNNMNKKAKVSKKSSPSSSSSTPPLLFPFPPHGHGMQISLPIQYVSPSSSIVPSSSSILSSSSSSSSLSATNIQNIQNPDISLPNGNKKNNKRK